jgi:PKD repeat protein
MPASAQTQTVNEGTQVTFNGSKTAPMEENLRFVWSFLDNGPKTLEGIIAFYTFEIPGVYSVNLTVDNSKGDKSNATIQVTVRDITPPIAVIFIERINPNQSIAVGQSITFNASQSYDPEGGKIQKYLWDLGDQTGNKPTSETITHQYTKAGTYIITLTVFDQRGNNSASQTTAITVGQEYSQAVKLPPIVIGILAVVTALVISGSAFWLRNRSPDSKQRK